MKNGNHISFDAFNLFNAQVPDVTYYYNSWLPYDAKNPANVNNPGINPLMGATAGIDGSPGFPGSAGVADYHFHPAEGRIVRVTYGMKL
jgi:hypothetical protein